jgi:hypothetical protein
MEEEEVCRGCGVARRRDDFALKNARTGRRHSRCKECGRRRSKDHYLANHAAYIARNRRDRPAQRVRNASIVLEYLLTHPCVGCGECDPVVLEFNHMDPRNKTGNVAEFVRSGCSKQRLHGEIRRPANSVVNARVTNFRAAANARNHQVVLQALSSAVCADCGELDPLVLQFDHLGDKADHIAWLVGSGCSPLLLARELSKREIRCANCHRRRTAEAGAWFRARSH